MNPTDQARKEARRRELKKNKKQRQMVRFYPTTLFKMLYVCFQATKFHLNKFVLQTLLYNLKKSRFLYLIQGLYRYSLY